MQNSRLSLKSIKGQRKFRKRNVAWRISSVAHARTNIPVKYTGLTVIGRGVRCAYGQREVKMAEIDYLFVWDKNKGWWLKIDTIEKMHTAFSLLQ